LQCAQTPMGRWKGRLRRSLKSRRGGAMKDEGRLVVMRCLVLFHWHCRGNYDTFGLDVRVRPTLSVAGTMTKGDNFRDLVNHMLVLLWLQQAKEKRDLPIPGSGHSNLTRKGTGQCRIHSNLQRMENIPCPPRPQVCSLLQLAPLLSTTRVTP
jgi:hypothetical protein